MRSLAAVAGLAIITLLACGPREPRTDAERLARGRELVQEMSTRLAAATQVSVTTTEVRDIVRASGAKERVSQTGVYTVRRPDRFYAKMTGGRTYTNVNKHLRKARARIRLEELRKAGAKTRDRCSS